MGGDMDEEITGLPKAVSSIVNKLVENEGAPFAFLVAAVGLNGAIWYGRVELIEAERGQCRTTRCCSRGIVPEATRAALWTKLRTLACGGPCSYRCPSPRA